MGKTKYYPVNEKISADEMRIIDDTGENQGVMSRDDALALAKRKELDLVVVAENAKPPVARMLEFRHFLRQQKDQERKAQRKSKQDIKQLRFGPNIADHDLNVRIKRAERFIDDGDKVKFTVQFRGRMITHKDVGRDKLHQIIEALGEKIDVEKDIWMEGSQMMLIIRPK
ncbi:translation initiation factor IF-3 [candidate division WWE3 bacterium]|uniref:Translation initiation factor IF-3 n=1 Tax=candidate division WWE3 bacterium TaxID=2053526 RepID=A0A955LWQ7_UNCKA|nr:translation initiation factor IF-3 [candidate division WWE3 bacterium]